MNRTWWVKLRRAEKHAAEFERTFNRLSKKDKAYLVEHRIETHRQGDQLVIRGYSWKFDGDEIAAIVGDVISNTRAALDHILVAISGNDEAQFPILTDDIWQPDPDPITGKDRNKPRRDRFNKWTAGTPGPALAFIKSAQPYKRWSKDPEFHQLAALNALSNADKHRTLLVMSPHLHDAQIECTFGNIPVPNQFPLNAGSRMSGAVLGIYPVPAAKTKVKVKAHGRVEVTLQGIHPLPTRAHFHLPSSIPNIVAYIRNEVITPLDAMIP